MSDDRGDNSDETQILTLRDMAVRPEDDDPESLAGALVRYDWDDDPDAPGPGDDV